MNFEVGEIWLYLELLKNGERISFSRRLTQNEIDQTYTAKHAVVIIKE